MTIHRAPQSNRTERVAGGYSLLRMLLVWCSSAACVGPAPREVDPWQLVSLPQVASLPQTVSLRGLSAVDAQVAWVSGSRGTVGRTVDGGARWQLCGPVSGASLDFRSVHAFDATTALVANAGTPARIYRTQDAGQSWQMVFEDPAPSAFFDGIAFASERNGLVFGDPDGRGMVMLATDDQGRSWRRLPPESLPRPLQGEAAFAASCTALIAQPSATLVQVTGGGTARMLRSDDGGARWSTSPLPMAQGEASQGAFAVAFGAGANMVAVGGDYLQPLRTAGTAAYSDDGGRTWRAADAEGFRCGLAWLPASQCYLAVGDRGASISRDGGEHWRGFGSEGFYAVRCTPDGAVWACGSGGRVAKLVRMP
jgi:photosystem II stability/assembly factor-like uncharacterized protein